MGSHQALREFINDRLTAAAAEIFTAVELTVVRYEETIERQRRLLDVTLKPQIKLHRIEFLEHHDCREEQLFEDQTNYCLEQEEPEPSRITEEPEPSRITEEPESSQVRKEPELPQIQDEPEVQTIREEPEPPQIREEPEVQMIREEPEPPHIIQEQEVQMIRTELLQLKEEHEEPGFTQTEEHSELCTGQNGERPVPCAEEQSYQSDREADSERFLCRDNEVHCAKKYIDSESTAHAELKQTSIFPSHPVDEVLVSEKQVECEETAGGNIHEGTESHQNLETPSNRKKMRCKICGRTYSRKRFFLAHVKTHQDEKQAQCEKLPFKETPGLNASERRKLYQKLGILNEKKLRCEFCDNSYSKKSFLMAHMRVHKDEDRAESKMPPRVETCRKNAAKKQATQQIDADKSRQKVKSPSLKKMVSCEVCGRTYTQSHTLLVHMRTHTGEKPYCCDVCGKKYSRGDGLVAHMRSHTGERPFSCDICGKRFSVRCHLLLHKRIHTGEKPHSCEICRRCFSLRSHLIAHMRTHSGERPFSCHICGKCFRSQGTVQVHMRIHTGERPFSCSVCGRSFTMQSHLLDHMRTHTGERPYVCELCAKAFSIHSNLVRHMKTHRDHVSFL